MLIEEILLIKHKDVYFGINTIDIGQILRFSETTPLALSPKEIHGMCAINGAIVTVLDFNLLLGLEPCDYKSSKSRIVTLGNEFELVAFLVDEVSVSVGIDQKNIEYLEQTDDPTIAVYRHNDILVQIVDISYLIGTVEKFIYSDFDVVAKLIEHDAGLSVDAQRYLVFKMNGELYALSMLDLREILSADIEICEMAGVNSEVCGMISLREELVVVLDLRKHYGFSALNSDKNRVVIISKNNKTIGLMIDEIVDIREYVESDCETGLINCGNELISLIDNSVIGELFSRNEHIIVANHQAVQKELEHEKREVVVFYIGNEEYAINLEEVAEIIDSVAVTPLSFVDDIVEGMINIRGQIVNIVSLHKRLGVTFEQNANQKIIISHVDGQRLGFYVNSVSSVTHVDQEQLHDNTIDGGLFSNVLHLDGGKRLVLLFNPNIANIIKGSV